VGAGKRTTPETIEGRGRENMRCVYKYGDWPHLGGLPETSKHGVLLRTRRTHDIEISFSI
jgi:hypothetical protein